MQINGTHSIAPLAVNGAAAATASTGSRPSTAIQDHVSAFTNAATHLMQISSGAGATGGAALQSAAGKLASAISALTGSAVLEDAVAQMMAEDTKSQGAQGRDCREGIKNQLGRVRQQNRAQINKIEERAKEIDKASEQSGCAKVFSFVIDIAKAVASCVTGNFVAAAAQLAGAVLKIAGQEELGQALGSVAGMLGNPIAEVAGSALQSATDGVDAKKREGHANKANDLLTQITRLGQDTARLKADAAKNIGAFGSIIGAAQEAFSVIENALDSQRTADQAAAAI